MKNNEKAIEKICYQNFINSKNNFDTMKLYAEDLNISIEKFLTYVSQYIEKNVFKPDYVQLLDILSILKNNEEVIEFFKMSKADHKYLNNNLLSYFVYYRPNIYYLQNEKCLDLRNKLKNYEIYLYRSLDPIRTTKKIDVDYAFNMINSFINSKYSVKRFCLNNGIRKNSLDNYVNIVKKINTDLYEKYIESINIKEKIKVKEIQNDVFNILEKIQEDPNNFTLIDFCLLTNYDTSELVETADNLLDIDNLKLFRKAVKSVRSINVISDDRLNQFFKTNFTFKIDDNLVNITDEDKYETIEFLKNNNIPICNETFKDGCSRLYKSKNKAKKI